MYVCPGLSFSRPCCLGDKLPGLALAWLTAWEWDVGLGDTQVSLDTEIPRKNWGVWLHLSFSPQARRRLRPFTLCSSGRIISLKSYSASASSW